MFNDDTNLKVLTLAEYILENQTTIRATSKEFNIPKSTVHNLLNTNLKQINFSLYKKVKILLENNFKIKHIHGGESTKLKYLKLKNEINKNDEYELFYN